jgi:hypothetical protein
MFHIPVACTICQYLDMAAMLQLDELDSHYLAADTGKPCCLLCTRQGNVIAWERGEESD